MASTFPKSLHMHFHCELQGRTIGTAINANFIMSVLIVSLDNFTFVSLLKYAEVDAFSDEWLTCNTIQYHIVLNIPPNFKLY
jgi:hypothetical protein